MFWNSGSGKIELQMTRVQAASVSHQGDCEADVKVLIVDEGIKAGKSNLQIVKEASK